MLVAAIVKFSGTSDSGDKNLLPCRCSSSVHFQIYEKNGNFVIISTLLKNINKSLCAIMKEARHARYMKI
jgi:hypothetical protein